MELMCLALAPVARRFRKGLLGPLRLPSPKSVPSLVASDARVGVTSPGQDSPGCAPHQGHAWRLPSSLEAPRPPTGQQARCEGLDGSLVSFYAISQMRCRVLSRQSQIPPGQPQRPPPGLQSCLEGAGRRCQESYLPPSVTDLW